MNLNSFMFVAFFVMCFASTFCITTITKNKPGVQKLAWKTSLLLFSLVFIAYADLRFLLLIVGYCFALFFLGIKVETKISPWLQIGIILSLLLLALFKYSDFFISSISDVLGIEYHTLSLILPLGISFYTLSGISYLIDVKRGKYNASQNILDILLYITFFGKLTAGPIVRFNTFEDSLKTWNGLKTDNFQVGIQFFVLGMFKKMVVADHLGVFVDDVFFAPTAFSSPTVFWAVISYSLQIYFDFSGYSDMAIGVARMLGIKFERNFNFPYISKNTTEFWKRWHISLSSWFQDYLYYPLGGNCKGMIPGYINLLIVMLISGLWHGADWTFIVWGGLHGVGLIVHKIWRKSRKKIDGKLWEIVSVVLTDFFVFFCWIFFRADSLGNAANVIRIVVIPHAGISQSYTWTMFAIIVLVAATVTIGLQNKMAMLTEMDYPLFDLRTVRGLTCFFIFCGLTIGMAYVGNTAFIYGMF